MKEETFAKIVEILRPFAKNADALATATMDTSFQKDLAINSARLVDIVLEIEDKFEIAVSDEDADKVTTIGQAVELVLRSKG